LIESIILLIESGDPTTQGLPSLFMKKIMVSEGLRDRPNDAAATSLL